MLTVLPLTLLALLFASPVFAEPASDNDAFRALALRKPKQPENPICCLKPLTPSEPVDDGVLVSFEEWKAKQLATQPETFVRGNEMNASNFAPPSDGSISNEPGGGSGETANPPGAADNLASSDATDAASQIPSGAHFRVPLTDRFNYASLDCSARVHTSHRSAKSPASILSSKRDRYMLSPCDKSKEKQFVVVEMCDDIRIDTVQLANFEFFSGVFKDFTVSVSKTYDLDPDSWTAVATYRAKNVRGVQSFHPPKSLRDFYRFIRIDFLSNYGNEFYCPVSLLRVYGLTHLEEWKWDTWEAESRSKQAELQRKRQPVISVDVPEARVADASMEEASSTTPDGNDTTQIRSDDRPPSSQAQVASVTPPSDPNDSKPQPQPTIPPSTHHDTTDGRLQPKPPSYTNTNAALVHHSTDTFVSIPSPPDQASNIPKASTSESSSPSTSPSSSKASASVSSSATTPDPASTTSNINAPVSSTSNSSQSSSIPNSSTPVPTPTPTIILSTSSAINVVPVPPPPPPLPPAIKATTGGGESIYRTIMNRLAEVELNQTLYMRYIEQQNVAVREVIKRLGEDVGRLEGISRAQSVTYQRNMHQWEKQRYQLEMEYGDLISRIEYLSEEIVLEKRLGVAQLCLLLAVLVFLGLTRGSRPPVDTLNMNSGFNQSVREWRRRHFRISGDWDWVGRLKGRGASRNGDGGGDGERARGRSRSGSRARLRTPPPVASARSKPKSARSYPPHLPLGLHSDDEDDNRVLFPSTSRPYRTKPLEPLKTIHLNTAPASRENFNRPRPRAISNPRSRAPSLRSTPVSRRTAQYNHARATTPTTSTFGIHSSGQATRPQAMQRSSSYGLPTPSSIPQSNSWGPMLGSGIGGGGGGGMPKSAKKWARTAHLHEVKRGSKKGLGGHDREEGDRERTLREFEFQREREDVFSPPRKENGKEKEGGGVPPPVDSLLFQGAVAVPTEDVGVDGDPWVDTDSVDGDADGEGSELDVDRLKVDSSSGTGTGTGPSPMSSLMSSPRDPTVRVVDMLPIPFPA
ncbi:hypothetical protein GALMADRAFT_206395 [Galerina marginata CBS 339.88]|uniref:SUN domain-containing protein n=1 Tax=Galerina marginata (strain CBS 339.88) TaxID=685588 RepID=A0A067TH70_GALM3|nr:hypothetical protein GALMADRAFT_206395 [Galerina marginata CBS 339.88]